MSGRVSRALAICVLILYALPGVVHSASPVYPLKPGADSRHLEDQAGVPFFMNGDTPWSLIVQLTKSEAEQYLEDRRAKGFNTVIVQLIEHQFGGPQNRYGELPFVPLWDFTQPNEVYFQHADWVIAKAAEKGMLVVLTPAYLGFNCGSEGWCQEMIASSADDLRLYGNFLGNRYKNFDNVIWMHGGDTSADQFGVMDKVRAIESGIREVDPSKFGTAHCFRQQSAIDCYDEAWLQINNTYSDCIASAFKTRSDYQRPRVLPFFYSEGRYENEGASDRCLRSQAYWSVLGGSIGHFFGNNPIWFFGPGWQSALNSVGAISMTHFRKLFESRYWSLLVPDYAESVVSGDRGNINNSSYVMAAHASDGSSIIVYLPERRTITVAMSAIDGTDANAWWYNPSNGDSVFIGIYPASGSRNFTPPNTGDWVLVIDDARLGFAPPGVQAVTLPPPNADTTPPGLVRATTTDDPNTVTVLFSEPVEIASSETVGNYSIDNAITISSAHLLPDQTTVELSTSGFTESVSYTLTVNNILDRAGVPNSIMANSTVEFQFPGSPGLVGWYRFNTDNSGLIADHSGNANDGVCTVGNTCPAFINNDGQPAGAYDFAGNGNYIDLNNESQFDFTNNFSVALWMKAGNLGTTWAQLIGKGDSSWSLDRAGSSNQLQFTTWASGFDELVGQTNVADGQWHHIAIVYDGSQKRLYVDGQVDAQRSYSQLLSTNNVAVRMGYNTEYPSAQYSGLLDDVRVYNRALSQAEIIALQTFNTPPGASIEQPVAGYLFRAGDIVSFAGTGTDAEDGNLPSQSFNWEVLFHHNGQTDPVLSLPSATQGSFTVPTAGLDTSGNIEYEIILTVSDSDGLADTVSRTLDPDRATITLDSVPPGLELILDGSLVTPPHSVDALIGYQHQISAPNNQFGNELYTFGSWSDGGSQSHVIIVPDIPTSYVASYNTDQDGDGLLNAWEIQFGLDPFDSSDATGDGDNDGLNNLQEQTLGTDPTNADTDGDGAMDGDEVSAGTDPVDPNSTPDPKDPDLVAWYRFDTDNSGLIADRSGNANDGVCTVGNTCPAFINNDGQPAGAYDFAGNGNYIDLNSESQFDFTRNFSVTLWMKAGNLGAAWAQLIGKGDSSWSLDRAGSSNQLQFTTWAPGFDELVGQVNVADGQWHHVAIVYDGSRKTLYVDGLVDAQRSYSRLLSTNNVAVRMGFNTEFPSGQYSGLLDDVRVYRRALSQGEIQQIKNAVIP